MSSIDPAGESRCALCGECCASIHVRSFSKKTYFFPFFFSFRGLLSFFLFPALFLPFLFVFSFRGLPFLFFVFLLFLAFFPFLLTFFFALFFLVFPLFFLFLLPLLEHLCLPHLHLPNCSSVFFVKWFPFSRRVFLARHLTKEDIDSLILRTLTRFRRMSVLISEISSDTLAGAVDLLTVSANRPIAQRS